MYWTSSAIWWTRCQTGWLVQLNGEGNFFSSRFPSCEQLKRTLRLSRRCGGVD
jgi:hypothetical protein